MNTEPIIGVIGGMGPHAGLDLVQKIIDQTAASTDHDHVPVALLSYPAHIPDRGDFLFGRTAVNPADAMAAIAVQLEALGATVAGIPCNTAHAPPIFDALQAALAEGGHRLRLLHMLDETARFLREHYPGLRRVGVLSTLGSYRFEIHTRMLADGGFEAVLPDPSVREHIVHRTIYDPGYGLKAQSNPVSPIARQCVLDAIDHLRGKGAEAVVLGCTELPLAVPEAEVCGVPLLDPALVLARALIQATYPDRLKPL